MPGKPPAAKKAKGRPHFGLGYNKNSANLTGEIQWTPDGWAPKDNSHKVTTQMRPLPELDMIPPQSTTYPEASSDRDKLKMLKNNVNMMTIGTDMLVFYKYIWIQCQKLSIAFKGQKSLLCNIRRLKVVEFL